MIKPDAAFKVDDLVTPVRSSDVYVVKMVEWNDKQWRYKVQLVNGERRTSFYHEQRSRWKKVGKA
jgi:hypothetical protein